MNEPLGVLFISSSFLILIFALVDLAGYLLWTTGYGWILARVGMKMSCGQCFAQSDVYAYSV